MDDDLRQYLHRKGWEYRPALPGTDLRHQLYAAGGLVPFLGCESLTDLKHILQLLRQKDEPEE